jgi:hypothetical protein
LAPPLVQYHLGLSGPTQGFGHGGYYTGDDHYKHVSDQQDRRASGQKKPDSPECETGPSSFPGDSSSFWSIARARGAEGWIFC